MKAPLSATALDQLFREGHTYHGFTAEPVSDATLRQLYDLLKWGPTAFNAQPARFVFVRSPEAKERLKPALSPGNVAQTMAAAATVIVGWDSRFHEHLPRLYPPYDAKPLFDKDPALTEFAGRRDATLQGAYLMLAARALGLDCGPMAGFDGAKVEAEFFPDGRHRTIFLCNLGNGDPAGVHPRNPRLDFEDAAQIL
ncbi:malonic semialdehyde reductase [Denitratisoma oestradiolicum]|uniref:Putative NADH dehydrogenase/NAD(P)H nitroreductase DENOEST_0403 n=1 Tax=Denitratisoma oestradiolicum TaxID=311182 RepID=A0A6S6Y4N6_9PROT|nr:malonic semialdehyde reductase [Denitratisoma oestradiolicum]TWO80502.1 malonic semialdehyde reductase [Denitratisoma oestradiolicum]CAB1367568.1 putative enzyme [Denitratisoma oestradiolicum]